MDFNTFNNSTSNQDKKSKIVLIIIIFFIVLLAAILGVYGYFVKNNENEAVKTELFSYLKNNDLNFFLNNELYQNINKKIEKQDFETTNYITFSTTLKDTLVSDLDLSKFQFIYNTKNNNSKNKKYSSLKIQYASNDFINMDMISTNNEVALKSDEIVNKYVGIAKKNLEPTINKLVEKNVDFSSMRKAKNFVFDRQSLPIDDIFNKNTLAEYSDIIKKYVVDAEIAKKDNLALEADSESIEVVEYSVNFSNQKFINMLNDLVSELEKDDKLLDELLVSDIKNFDDDDNTIVDYKDNENVVEISGEKNNFDATIQIWSANTVRIDEQNTNTVNENNDLNTISNSVNTIDNGNTVINENPVQNSVQTNTVNIEQNTVPNNSVSVNNDNQSENEQHQQNDDNDNNSQIQENNVDYSQEEIIEEDENMRTQGYISINDEKEETDDTTFVVGENFEETEKNIVKLTNKINWISYLLTGAKANYSREEIIEEIQRKVKEFEKNDCSLIVKVYVSKKDNSVIKVAFEIPEKSQTLDFQIISKGDKEKYLNITDIVGEDSNGYRISIYKKNADANIKNKININKIQKNKIIEKYTINLETKGTMNSKKYSTNIEFLYSGDKGEFRSNIDNTLNFDTNIEIEDLNDENCLFIDKLEDNELLATRDAIKQKSYSVFSEKNKTLNIIDINNSNSIVQQLEENTESEDTTAKLEVKNVLIEKISGLMGEYQNQGKTFGLSDLEGLEISGYEVKVSITSNLAIINVNGYTFKLDSDFNLSDS